MPDDDAVLRDDRNGVAWITLNRPDAGNAMTYAMRNQISEWLDDISASVTVRAVVITGAGEKGFCTGADLRGGGPPQPERPQGAPRYEPARRRCSHQAQEGSSNEE